MKKILIALFIFGVAVLAWNFTTNHKNSREDGSLEESGQAEGVPASEIEAPQPNAAQTSVQSGPSAASGGFLPTQMAEPERFQKIQAELKNLGQCLGISVGTLDANEEFNMGTFTAAIQAELGEVALVEEEWHSTDIQTSSGEMRRILISGDEMDGGEKTLKYVAYRNGVEVDLGLTPEQTKNPSETFVAGLEKDGTLVSKSSASKAIFANGATVSIREKDGKINSFQLPHNGKSFSCTGLDSAAVKCSCR